MADNDAHQIEPEIFDSLTLDDPLNDPLRRSTVGSHAQTGHPPTRYVFSQLFGELLNDPQYITTKNDMISAVQFNTTGDMIAAGDRGGRVTLVKRLSPSEQREQTQRSHADSRETWSQTGIPSDDFNSQSDDTSDDEPEVVSDRPIFDFWWQFQSHKKELDYLRNIDIEEKINQIRWCRPTSGSHRLLVSNETKIKLWRVGLRKVRELGTMDHRSVPSRNGAPSRQSRPLHQQARTVLSRQFPDSPSRHTHQNTSKDSSYLRVPHLDTHPSIVVTDLKQMYSSSQLYNINTISLNSDEETFLSADDLRINLWSLHRGGQGFNILDIEPNTVRKISEILTGAEFHPQHCNIFAYSNTQAMVKLCDLRESALCRRWVRKFEEAEPAANQTSFFAEIIASIADMKFSPDGQFIMTRDYMNLRLWDVRMETEPVLFIPIHEHLRSRLCDLYQNDCIFDKFQCRFSEDGRSLLTGSYNALFQTYSAFDGSCSAVEASMETVTGLSGRQHYSAAGLSASLLANSSVGELVDPTRRIMCLDASPVDELAAVAVGPAVYFYYGGRR